MDPTRHARWAGLSLVLVLFACDARGEDSTEAADTRSLKDLAAARGARVGAYYQYDYRDEEYDAVFEREFDLLTLGFFWEWERPSRASYDFTSSDDVVEFATQRGMAIHGHVLVWFEEIPAWVRSLRPSQVEGVMNEHIDTVVGRYRGRIRLWDVVNEAFDDEGRLRRGHKWFEAMGPSYIRKAFLRAHRADAQAVLRYNEYDLEDNEAKYNGVRRFLKRLKDTRVPVHALGWQMHLDLNGFDADTLLERFNGIADLGIDNYITELDVELPSDPTDADYERQREIYKSVISVFLQARRHRTIVVWGLRDGDPYWLTDGHPLPFDEEYRKKPAYFGIQEALTEGQDDDED